MKMVNKIKISDYNYDLPISKIAYYPKENRDESKLLVYKNKTIQDSIFKDLPQFLTSEDILVFNDSKVIHARIVVYNTTGAKIEIFCLEPKAPTTIITQSFEQTKQVTWKCFVGNAKKWKNIITFEVDFKETQLSISASKVENGDGTFLVTFTWIDSSITFSEWLDAYGKMPLPPYIKRDAETVDENRYQTVYAQHNGSVAAPTAGLHFSDEVFQSLFKMGIETLWVTLHVGAGTFKPVTSEYINDHFMHQEQIIVSKEMIYRLLNIKEKRIIAVGTTVARTLESIFIIGAKLFLNIENPFIVKQWEVYDHNIEISIVTKEESLSAILKYLNEHELDNLVGETSLMIIPGYQHKIAKGIVTNFHQPQSTLLLLISSYIGDEWKKLYQYAINHDYRFLSYGDANLYI
jgi:S-adenosylmethionine:tRNA ribosyltransferase-isomerase